MKMKSSGLRVLAALLCTVALGATACSSTVTTSVEQSAASTSTPEPVVAARQVDVAPTPTETVEPAATPEPSPTAPAAVAPPVTTVTVSELGDHFVFDSGTSLVAFQDHETIYVLEGGAGGEIMQPGWVGVGSGPVWSGDGRYLAWTEGFEVDVPAGSDQMYGLWRIHIHLLDVTTGQRFELETAAGYEGTLFAREQGFVAIVRDADADLVSAKRFQVIDPAALVAGEEPPIIEASFDPVLLAATGFEDHEFFWADLADGQLYAVVTGASGTWYRYDPVLWRVGLDGVATRLFADCEEPEERCFNNYGMNGLSVSPDGDHVVYETGARDGCDAYTSPRLMAMPGGPPIALQGLPRIVESASWSMHDVTWSSNDEFVMTVQLFDHPDGHARCTYPELSEPTSYRCTITGDCTEVGPVSEQIIASDAGDQAVVAAEPSYSANRLVTITWADGTQQPIFAIPWGIAWSR